MVKPSDYLAVTFNLIVLIIGMFNLKSREAKNILYVSLYTWAGLYILKGTRGISFSGLFIWIFLAGYIAICIKLYRIKS